MIRAGGECEKKLYKEELFKIDRRLLEAREDAIIEVLDAIFRSIVNLESKHVDSFACKGAGCSYCRALSDVRDIIEKYKGPFFIQLAVPDEKPKIFIPDLSTGNVPRQITSDGTSDVPYEIVTNGTSYTNFTLLASKNCVCPHYGINCEDCHGRQ